MEHPVISPLISLMKDQVDALTLRGVPAGLSLAPRVRRAERGGLYLLSEELKLLYIAPERFQNSILCESSQDESRSRRS